MKDLIKRLRDPLNDDPYADLLLAADALEAQQARIAELRIFMEEVGTLVLCGKKDQLPGRCNQVTEVVKMALSRTNNPSALQEMRAGYEARILQLSATVDTLLNGLRWHIYVHPEIMNECDNEALSEAEAVLNTNDPMSTLAAHDAEVRKAALLEASDMLADCHFVDHWLEPANAVRRMAGEVKP